MLLLVIFFKLWHDSIAPVDGLWFGGLALLLFFGVLSGLHPVADPLRLRRFAEDAESPGSAANAGGFRPLSARAVANFGHLLFGHRASDSHLALLVKQYEILTRLAGLPR